MQSCSVVWLYWWLSVFEGVDATTAVAIESRLGSWHWNDRLVRSRMGELICSKFFVYKNYVNFHHQTLPQRQEVLAKGQTAYFTSVVVAQWMDVCVNKTRRTSLFTHGFGWAHSKRWFVTYHLTYFSNSNHFLTFSIFLETGVACLVVYCPGLNEVLTFSPVSGWAWCTGVPFFCYLLVYEELRKLIVRRFPMSYIGTELAR